MKTLIHFLNNRSVLALLILVGFSVDLFFIGRSYELDKNSWATWVGSIGTLGTLLGTIYLARTETNRRRRQEHDAAIIAAAFMDLPLISYQRILVETIVELKKHVEDDTSNPWKKYVSNLEQCPRRTRDELQPLLYLGHHVAANLAIAQEYVRNAREQLALAASGRELGLLDVVELSDLNEGVVTVLDDAHARVAGAFAVCSLLLDRARVV